MSEGGDLSAWKDKLSEGCPKQHKTAPLQAIAPSRTCNALICKPIAARFVKIIPSFAETAKRRNPVFWPLGGHFGPMGSHLSDFQGLP